MQQTMAQFCVVAFLLAVESFARRQRPSSLLEVRARSNAKFAPSRLSSLPSRASDHYVGRRPTATSKAVVASRLVQHMRKDRSEGVNTPEAMSTVPRGLSLEEEQACTKAVKKLLVWEEQYDALKDSLGHEPTYEEWGALCGFSSASEFQDELQVSESARRKMLSSNLGLVYSLAKQFKQIRHPGYTFQDMVNEGTLGLAHALNKFDPGRGKFSTYAYPWIKTFILQGSDSSDIVKLTIYKKRQLRQVDQVTRNLTADLGREPSQAEIAQHMGISERKFHVLQSLRNKPISLDTTMLAPSYPISDIVPHDAELGVSGFQDAEKEFEYKLVKERIEKVLVPRERMVIMMREGLADGGKQMSFRKIGETIGISRSMAKNDYERALSKLRQVYFQDSF